ncbi:hypothetical protein HPB49_023547 [Dermacentor silvarum]|uniref:Uncharacterized protein n=1 Tax=Dermacentor silvarum TaxID=543639 RepID=A0ACB8E429_DERSI|nr:hypothetical protein HPB49_023547 [Dermacentor silvarum]
MERLMMRSSPSNYNDVKLKLLQEGGLEFRDADMLYPGDPTAQVVSYAAGPLQPLPPHEDVYGSTQLGAIMDLQQQPQPQHVQAAQVQDHEPKKKRARRRFSERSPGRPFRGGGGGAVKGEGSCGSPCGGGYSCGSPPAGARKILGCATRWHPALFAVCCACLPAPLVGTRLGERTVTPADVSSGGPKRAARASTHTAASEYRKSATAAGGAEREPHVCLRGENSFGEHTQAVRKNDAGVAIVILSAPRLRSVRGVAELPFFNKRWEMSSTPPPPSHPAFWGDGIKVNQNGRASALPHTPEEELSPIEAPV